MWGGAISIITDPEAEILHQVLPDLTTDQLEGPELQECIQELKRLIDTGYTHGVGLAATQIGIPLRVTIFRSHEGADITVAVNLHVTRTWGQRRIAEACLSVPYRQGFPYRAERVSAEWMSTKGQRMSVRRAVGLYAQVLQHECDHLDGIIYTEREDPIKANLNART